MTDIVEEATGATAPNAGYTRVRVVLDGSGSMSSIADDVIGGFNGFLAEQRAASGKATLSLVQFNESDRGKHTMERARRGR